MMNMLAVTAMSARRRVSPSGFAARYGLDFPSNVTGGDTSAPFVAFQYLNPDSNGLPFCGPSNAGVTYMWEVKPRQQTGYYATLWRSSADGVFRPSNAYMGGHPYPQSANNSGTTHWWEIAAAGGGDYFATVSGATNVTVVKDVTYTQALQVIRNGNGSKTYRFYYQLPAVTTADIIEYTTSTGGSDSSETEVAPAITFGDSPWYASYQHERLSGVLGRVKILAKAISQADIVSEANSMGSLVTSDGIATNWWSKKGFTSVDDLTDDYGTGRAFSWANANKATLVTLP